MWAGRMVTQCCVDFAMAGKMGIEVAGDDFKVFERRPILT